MPVTLEYEPSRGVIHVANQNGSGFYRLKEQRGSWENHGKDWPIPFPPRIQRAIVRALRVLAKG